VISRTSLFFLCAVLVPAAHAQWVTYPDAGVPRTRDGKVDLNAPAPRVNGKPDLSGVWHVIPTPYTELKRIFGPFVDSAAKLTVPGMELELVNKYFVSVLADFKPDEAPMRPEGTAALRQRANRPMRVCLPAGPLVPYFPSPTRSFRRGARLSSCTKLTAAIDKSLTMDARFPRNSYSHPGEAFPSANGTATR
jgi:hypothetical protein